MTGFLRGSATAMITPFCEDGINFASFEKMLEYQIENGTDALVVLGTTGEPATMSETEKESLIRFAVEKVAHRAKVIIGTGGNNTAKAVAASVRAEELGADGVLAVTPYYNKCTQAGIVEYYRAICAAVKIPVIAYNVPGRTGVNILPETMAAIAEIPNIAGIKEASGNMAQVVETARLIRGKCDLYSGEDTLNLPILAVGGVAVISVVSNIAPKDVKALTDAVLARKLYAANKIADKLFPLVKACFLEVNPIPVKEGMQALGFEAGAPRSPLTRLEEAHCARLYAAMREYGFEVKA
ncbi:MAG: 4-hydroxy-tetrahydrodipicolinate synthase [Clostridia bacterium]|nr:4-hydroxy-tetrahydrodipicolinate synthase [Clostridia bacterium]